MNELQIEIAQVAARLIAEEGWPWSGAKQRALRELGLPPRTALPGSDLVEDMLRELNGTIQNMLNRGLNERRSIFR